MVAMAVSGSGSEGDHASLCSNVYAMKHCSSNIHGAMPYHCLVDTLPFLLTFFGLCHSSEWEWE